ncbi:MAG: prepilin-type N-terminal cleavage/methylation domain-containing protein [Planctomycetota bacterium]|nr:prepilin-type N-terminal cleavage/methylation domain-containing protein [Planctomycetota bacterium]
MKHHQQYRRADGFTLLEILIALVVLTVGIMGILAIFPAGIDSTRESTESTIAAVIAQSAHNSLVIGFRSAAPETLAGPNPLTFHHDGMPDGVYTFNRPTVVGAEVQVPNPAGATDPEKGTDVTRTVFLMANALGNTQLSYIRHSLLNINENPGTLPSEIPSADQLGADSTDRLDQYSFCLTVRRESPLDARLYYVRVDIFRNYALVTEPAPGWPLNRNSGLWLPSPPHNTPWAHPTLVRSFGFYVHGS